MTTTAERLHAFENERRHIISMRKQYSEDHRPLPQDKSALPFFCFSLFCLAIQLKLTLYSFSIRVDTEKATNIKQSAPTLPLDRFLSRKQQSTHCSRKKERQRPKPLTSVPEFVNSILVAIWTTIKKTKITICRSYWTRSSQRVFSLRESCSYLKKERCEDVSLPRSQN